MKMLRRSGIAALALLALVTAAWAIQPGTSGTYKATQQQGVRVGVLECFNNAGTSSGGAVTLNGTGLNPSSCGTITTEALTTLVGSDYTLTMTNNLVAAKDIILASVQNGTNTAGAPILRTITPAAGSVAFVIRNGASTDATMNGSLKVNFYIIKQSAHDSD